MVGEHVFVRTNVRAGGGYANKCSGVHTFDEQTFGKSTGRGSRDFRGGVVGVSRGTRTGVR